MDRRPYELELLESDGGGGLDSELESDGGGLEDDDGGGLDDDELVDGVPHGPWLRLNCPDQPP